MTDQYLALFDEHGAELTEPGYERQPFTGAGCYEFRSTGYWTGLPRLALVFNTKVGGKADPKIGGIPITFDQRYQVVADDSIWITVT